MVKIAIVGSRSFKDYELLKTTIIDYCDNNNIDCADGMITIVSGGANGADKLGERFADSMNFKKEIFLPDWEKHGRSAGFKRNITIVENSDIVFAFWDEVSKGTQHTMNLATKANKILIVVKFNIQKEIIKSSDL